MVNLLNYEISFGQRRHLPVKTVSGPFLERKIVVKNSKQIKDMVARVIDYLA